MATIASNLRMSDKTRKWGLVTVFDVNGSIVEEYIIDKKELLEIEENNAIPSMCSEEQWASGLVGVSSRPCDVGEAFHNPDGTMVVNLGVVEDKQNKRVTINLEELTPEDWTLQNGNIEIVNSSKVQALTAVVYRKVKPEL